MHHLYADDTEIFFSFYAPDFLSNITYLLNALQHISSWMTSNLLTLNTSKTEFLLIGLKQQLTKIQNCTLNTNHSPRNLGFIFGKRTKRPVDGRRGALKLADLTLVDKVAGVDIDGPDSDGPRKQGWTLTDHN